MSYDATNERKPGEDMVAYEERLVRDIGTRIGYGRTIQLCERLWSDLLCSVSPAAHASARLEAYDEREPLVKALVAAVMDEPGETPFDQAAYRVGSFKMCITPASTDVASEANAADSSGSEPAE